VCYCSIKRWESNLLSMYARYRFRPLQHRCATLTRANPPDRPLFEIRAQCLDDDLDGHVRVDAVLVVEVDVVGFQPLRAQRNVRLYKS